MICEKLSNNWTLRGPIYKDKIKSIDHPEATYQVKKMPTMVHTILEDYSVIDTPWKSGEAEKIKWVAEGEWEYTLKFNAKEFKGRAYLLFEGMDSIVDIFLNGEHIGFSKNTYAPLKIDVCDKLKKENTLSIYFHIAITENGEKNPEFLPFRKAQQDYITYLGPNPYFCRVGVFRDISLIYVEGGEISEYMVGTSLSDDLQTGTIEISASGEVTSNNVVLSAKLYDQNENLVAHEDFSIKKEGINFNIEDNFKIEKPEPWYPIGYGSQPLYKIVLTLFADGVKIDERVKITGFRSLKMSKPLHFVVNNKPVRMWGACYVSNDHLTMVWNEERTQKTLQLLLDCNMNSLRIWGVSEAQPEQFYEMCDQMGIMVWQDFHHMPLGNDEESIKQATNEAALTIQLLKSHPSVFLWCGGNEAKMWHEFNKKAKGEFGGTQTAEVRLANVCKKLDPQRVYIPNSPYYGHDTNDPRVWDTHGYTNLWFVPYYNYLNYASEDTRISAPELRTIRKFFAPEHIWPKDYSPVYTYGNNSPWPEAWNLYTTSLSNRKTGDIEHYYDADSPEMLIYRLGMSCGDYYIDTIERQRRGRPSGSTSKERCCGGYLAWKFNDSWPQMYSAKLDYFLEPYIAYFSMKRAFAPVLLSFDTDVYTSLWVVNDTKDTISGTVYVKLFDMVENQVVESTKLQVNVAPDGSLEVIDLTELFGTYSRDFILFASMIDENGKEIARTNKIMDYERRLLFPQAKLNISQEGNELIITTDKFARSIVLTGNDNGDEFGFEFSDNYFDLLPGETKHITIKGRHTSGIITARPIYNKEGISIENYVF